MARQRAGIIAGGNWIVDHVKLVDTWPPQDSLANILGESPGNGGSPYNLLKNISKLGAKYALEAVGLVGEDVDGDRILEDCRLHGIAAGQLRRTSRAATSYTDVMTVQATGRRTFFHQRGANAFLAPEHFDFSRTRAKYFHLGYLLLLDELDRLESGIPRACAVLRQARAAGLRTSVDCVSEHSDRFRKVVLPMLPDVDLLFVNDTEAERLTGRTLRVAGALRPDRAERAARDLLRQGVREWVILHFPEGVFALDRRETGHWQSSLAVPPREIKGAAGAGDALASGVLHGLLSDWSMAKSLRLGVTVAARSLLDPTCSGGVASARTCLALERRWKFRAPLRK